MSDQTTNLPAPTGIVLNIQRYCSHDGPGIRTNVFLKGCSLRCKWCGNPESIRVKPELSYDPKKCKGRECSLCLKAPFPPGAFYFTDGEEGPVKVNWDLTSGCDEAMCSLCPTGALEMYRQAHDRGRSAGRGGEGRVHLPQFRRRHHAQRRRVHVATGLQCRLARGAHTSGASTRPSKRPATSLGRTLKKCCPMWTRCCTTTS